MEILGENYEYIKTIISNKVEIAKLDVTEMIGNLVGFLMLGFVLISLGVIVIIGLLALLVVWLKIITGSLILGISIACLMTIIIGVILYFNRERLIINPILNAVGKMVIENQ